MRRDARPAEPRAPDRPLRPRLPAGDGRAPASSLARAIRDAEAPTVASRWLLRLENLLAGLGARGQAALDAARAPRRAPARLAGAARPARRAASRPRRRPAPRPPAAARPAGALGHPDRGAGPRPLRDLRPQGPAPAAPRPARAASPTRWPAARAIHAALDAFVARDPRRPSRRRRGGLRARPSARPSTPPRPGPRSTRSGPRGSSAPPAGSSPARPTAAPAPRPPPARCSGAARSTASPLPFAVTAKADRIDRTAAAATRSTTTSPATPRAGPRRAAFYLQLPLEAAIAAAGGFDGLPRRPAPPPRAARHRRAARSLALDASPTRVAATWARLARLIAALPGPRDRLRRPPAAAAAELPRRLRPPRRGSANGPTATPPTPERLAVTDALAAQIARRPPRRLELGRRQRRLGQDPGADRPGRAAAARRHRARSASSASPTPRPPPPRCRPGCSAPSAPGRCSTTPSLRAALAALGEPGDAIPPARLARARTLFARALETPGGLQIQTIHAFCEALLRRFPLEAGVAPRFAVLDDRQARALRERGARRARQRRARRLRRHRAAISRRRSRPAPARDRPAPRRLRRALRPRRPRRARSAPIPASTLEAPARPRPSPPRHETRSPPSSRSLAASGPRDRAAGEALAARARRHRRREPPGRPRRCAPHRDRRRCALHRQGRPFPTKPRAPRPSRPLRRARRADARASSAAARRAGSPRRLRALDRPQRFARAWLAAYGARKRRARPARLRRHDRPRPRSARAARHRRLGALEARRRPRPHPRRRGAGHEPGAMAGDRRRSPTSSSPARAPADVARTLFVVGDEKQSIYSFQGADPGRVRRQARPLRRACSPTSAHALAALRPALFVPLGAADPRARRQVFAGPAGEGLAGRRRTTTRSTPRCPAASSSGRSSPKPERAGRAALGRAPRNRRPRRSRRARWPPRIAGDDRRLARRAAASCPGEDRPADPRRRRHGPGPAPRPDLRRGDPRAEAGQRAGRRRRPAAHRRRARGQRPARRAALRRHPARRPLARRLPAQPARRRLASATSSSSPTAAPAALWRALRADPRTAGPSRGRCSPTCAPRPTTCARSSSSTRMLIRHDGRRRLVARLGPEAEDGIDALLDQALAYEQRRAAVAHRLPRLDRPATGGGQAPQRRRRRPGPGDDRPRRQGPRGADRHPARHRRPPGRRRTPPPVLRLETACRRGAAARRRLPHGSPTPRPTRAQAPSGARAGACSTSP